MPPSADCINTQSINGRNLTPLSIITAARNTLGHIQLDPASDALANTHTQAERYFTEGFHKAWFSDTVWLNPPGRTTDKGFKVSGSQWGRKLHRCWILGYINHAIYLCYRGGSLGSLGKEMISDSTLCITASGASSDAINGSGRLSFDNVIDGERVPGTSNTQSSVILLLTRDVEVWKRFKENFNQFGVVIP
jgi:hypothetical protein